MLKGNLTCTMVGKLLTHYVEDNLDNKSKSMVTMHLRNCPLCMEKYSVVKKLFLEAEKKRKMIREKEGMYEEISAYIDGEISKNEIDEFEKKLSQKPEYDDALIDVMRVKRAMNNSFYKMQYNLKTDFAKKVIEKLKQKRSLKDKIKDFFSYFFQ